MTKFQRIRLWISILAPYVVFTLALYHCFKAVPVGKGYLVATDAFLALFFMLSAIFIMVTPRGIDDDR